MQTSKMRILTTHIGSLPRPAPLLEMNLQRFEGKASAEAFDALLGKSVADVVARQIDCGVDIVNDGEYGKSMTNPKDFGPWMGYVWERLGGWERTSQVTPPPHLRDADRFPEFYGGMWHEMGAPKGSALQMGLGCVFNDPVRYTGQSLIARDLRNLRAAMQGRPCEEAFVTAIAPGSFNRGQNRYYRGNREFLLVLADALHEEYRAVVDAGFILQIDDPSLADAWHMAPAGVSREQYREALSDNIEAVNRAIEGLPRERIRYHVCWGSWHGPHTTDIPLEDIVDRILSVTVGAYALEAGNVRHQLDYRVWQRISLPDDFSLIPGVVSHSTNIVEPAELIADRICQYAEIFGRERIIAGTDCGLGGRVHPEIAWAKLRALADGARLASERLWGK